jgi:hypothetical protein
MEGRFVEPLHRKYFSVEAEDHTLAAGQKLTGQYQLFGCDMDDGAAPVDPDVFRLRGTRRRKGAHQDHALLRFCRKQHRAEVEEETQKRRQEDECAAPRAHSYCQP